MKVITLFGSKGGISKSCTCKLIAKTLADNGRSVWGADNDGQDHFGTYLEANHKEIENPDFFIIDTIGVWSRTNQDLLNDLKKEDHIILIPVNDTEDEIKEAIETAERITGNVLQDNSYFLFTRLHHARKYPVDIAERLQQTGIKVLDTVIPHLSKYKNLNIKNDKTITALLNELGIEL